MDSRLALCQLTLLIEHLTKLHLWLARSHPKESLLRFSRPLPLKYTLFSFLISPMTQIYKIWLQELTFTIGTRRRINFSLDLLSVCPTITLPSTVLAASLLEIALKHSIWEAPSLTEIYLSLLQAHYTILAIATFSWSEDPAVNVLASPSTLTVLVWLLAPLTLSSTGTPV